MPSWMDSETLALADRHFRGLGGGVPGVGQAPGRVAFISEPGAFSYADFVRGFLLPNLPCVFSSAFTQSWGSRRRWVTPAGRPDFDYLLRTYGGGGGRRPRAGRTGRRDPGPGGLCLVRGTREGEGGQARGPWRVPLQTVWSEDGAQGDGMDRP